MFLFKRKFESNMVDQGAQKFNAMNEDRLPENCALLEEWEFAEVFGAGPLDGAETGRL